MGNSPSYLRLREITYSPFEFTSPSRDDHGGIIEKNYIPTASLKGDK